VKQLKIGWPQGGDEEKSILQEKVGKKEGRKKLVGKGHFEQKKKGQIPSLYREWDFGVDRGRKQNEQTDGGTNREKRKGAQVEGGEGAHPFCKNQLEYPHVRNGDNGDVSPFQAGKEGRRKGFWRVRKKSFVRRNLESGLLIAFDKPPVEGTGKGG